MLAAQKRTSKQSEQLQNLLWLLEFYFLSFVVC